MYVPDYVLNGQGFGELGEVMQQVHFDKGLLRPFVDRRGVKRCVMNVGKKFDPKTKKDVDQFADVMISDIIGRLGINLPIFNATTTLRKEEWIRFDQIAVKAARYNLKAWADLAASASYSGFDGMSQMSLEHETMSDPGEALIDLEGTTEGRQDMPLYQLEALPLPITHMDWYITARKLANSRKMGTPLNTTMATAAARRVAESVEKVTIGTRTGITYGPGSNSPSVGRTSKVYGYTNFTARQTFTGTAPTGSNASTILANVLSMRQQLYNSKFGGPFMVYHSNDWDNYLDNDYILSGGNTATQTLRKRLESIDNINGVRRLDFLWGTTPTAGTGNLDMITSDNVYPYAMLMVQMTEEVARAVIGMDISTVQWESQGGMKINFKTMAIMVPQLRADFYNNCGILHATFS